jgi:hypothetical protein
VIDAQAPVSLVDVHTFIALPSLQIDPLVHVVAPPPLLLALPPLLPPLLPPPLPLPPPSTAVLPCLSFPPSGFEAPEQAATSATAPIHPPIHLKRATLMPSAYVGGFGILPCGGMWTRSTSGPSPSDGAAQEIGILEIRR